MAFAISTVMGKRRFLFIGFLVWLFIFFFVVIWRANSHQDLILNCKFTDGFLHWKRFLSGGNVHLITYEEQRVIQITGDFGKRSNLKGIYQIIPILESGLTQNAGLTFSVDYKFDQVHYSNLYIHIHAGFSENNYTDSKPLKSEQIPPSSSWKSHSFSFCLRSNADLATNLHLEHLVVYILRDGEGDGNIFIKEATLQAQKMDNICEIATLTDSRDKNVIFEPFFLKGKKSDIPDSQTDISLILQLTYPDLALIGPLVEQWQGLSRLGYVHPSYERKITPQNGMRSFLLIAPSGRI